jgi:hypothetical protein
MGEDPKTFCVRWIAEKVTALEHWIYGFLVNQAQLWGSDTGSLTSTVSVVTSVASEFASGLTLKT